MSLNLKNVVYLVGFMAVGKSTVGRQLADVLGYHFFDTDAEIELSSGLKISQIFEQQGEQAFRDLETKALARLKGHDRAVVSTGGGIVGSVDNWHIMKQSGTVVYLHADWSTIESRLVDTSHRPLAKNGTDTQLHQLWQKRLPLYQQADVTIVTDQLNPQQVVDEILLALYPEIN
ncbi:MAG: hypothetical protein B6I37_09115 [Desulfobacteraceae bacterium 4572_35.2]|nr:MAG: hypothetical protein B6I37_09115 [Desulfobacteraceae bacterium 4572_35.2]